MNHSNSFSPAILAICLAAASPLYTAQAQNAATLPQPGVQVPNTAQNNPPSGPAGASQPAPVSGASSDSEPNPPAAQASSGDQPQPSEKDQAAQQIKAQERQRILGIVPNFNTSYVTNAAPLSPHQKFSLAFRSAVDPFIFVAAAADAGISQAENDFPGYGQGAQGYGKRFGAAYLDDFDGTMIGNAFFPVILRQDPRYFRKGTGPFTHRLLYSISTTVWTKNDNGKWGPNYSNVLGNLAAGGISNLYYPAADRGAALTFERGLTVTAEGTLGALTDEFWPDIAHKLFERRFTKLQGNIPPPTPSAQPAPQTPQQ